MIPEKGSLLFAALAASACFLPDFDLTGRPCPCADGWTCDTATQTCVQGGASGGGAAGAGGPGGAAQGAGGQGGQAQGGQAQGGGGGSGGGGLAVVPLVREGDVASGAIALRADGVFELQASAAAKWHLAHWYDLASDPDRAHDLAAKKIAANVYADALHTVWANYGAGYASAEDGTVTGASLIDETPVRATLVTDIDLPAQLPASHARFAYTVYASGHVAIESTLSCATVGQTASAIEALYTSVHVELAWQSVDPVTVPGAAYFQRAEGPSPRPNLVIVNHDTPGTREHDDLASNRYWNSFDYALASPQVGRASYVLAPSGLTLSELQLRAEDLAAPGATVVAGAPALVYEPTAGAYVATLSDPAAGLSFRLDPGKPRFAPAFELHGWTASTFSIQIDGQPVASDASPVGPAGVARLDPSAQTLVFQYAGDVAPATPSDAPLFEVTP